MGLVADLSRLFSSDAISLEQLRANIELLVRESKSAAVRVQELEAALREKQHIGNEELQGVISKYNEAVFQKNELELKLFDLKEEKLTLRGANEELAKKVGALTDQLSVLGKDQMVARMESQDVLAELQVYRAQLDGLKARCDTLAAEKEALQRDLAQQERDLLGRLQAAQDSKLHMAQELEARHLSYAGSLAAERDRLRAELEAAQSDLTRASREKEHLAASMSRLQETLDDLHSNQETLLRSKEQLETSLRDSAGQLTQFQTEHRIRYEVSVTQAQQQLSEVSRQNLDLQQQLGQLQARHADLGKEADELRRDHAARLVTLDKLRFENGQLALTVEEVRRDVRSKECEVEAMEKSLNYQIDSVDRARKLMQEEYERERGERIEAEARLRQAEFGLLENASKVFMLEKQTFEVGRLNELLRNEAESKAKLEAALESQRGDLLGAREQLKTREGDWERERSTLLHQVRSLQADL